MARHRARHGELASRTVTVLRLPPDSLAGGPRRVRPGAPAWAGTPRRDLRRAGPSPASPAVPAP